MVLVGTEALQSFFRSECWFRVKVRRKSSSDDAVVGNEKPIRARRGQVGSEQKSRPVAASLRGMGRLWRGMGDPSRCLCSRCSRRLFGIVQQKILSWSSVPSTFTPATGPVRFSRNTKHESRAPWVHKGRTSHETPARDTETRRPVAAFLCVVARHGRHGAAMERHGRPSVPPPFQHWPVGFSRIRKNETRNKVIPRPGEQPAAMSKESNPKPDQQVFTNQETRNTKHGFFRHGCDKGRTIRNPRQDRRFTPPGRCFPVRGGAAAAAWRGYGAAWAAVVPRTGNTACWVFTSHEARNTVFPVPAATPRRATPSPTNRFSRITKHETRNTNFCGTALDSSTSHESEKRTHGFPRPCGDSKESNSKPDQRVSRITKHETRIPRHETRTRPFGFSPATRHETRFSPSLRRLQGEQPQPRPTGFSRITKHETRITAFMLPYSPFPTISHDFPAFPGNIRPPPHPPQPIKGSPAVHRSGWVSRRAPFVGNPTKMHKIPDPTGKCAKHSVRRGRRLSAAANPE